MRTWLSAHDFLERAFYVGMILTSQDPDNQRWLKPHVAVWIMRRDGYFGKPVCEPGCSRRANRGIFKQAAPADLHGLPLDPTRIYATVDSHASGEHHEVANLTTRLPGDHPMVTRTPSLWFDITGLDDKGIASVRAAYANRRFDQLVFTEDPDITKNHNGLTPVARR